MATDWRAEYAKAAALQETDDVSEAASSVQQPQKTPEDGVLAFVDLLLAQEGGEWWVKLQRQAKRVAKQKAAQGDEEAAGGCGQGAAVGAVGAERLREQQRRAARSQSARAAAAVRVAHAELRHAGQEEEGAEEDAEEGDPRPAGPRGIAAGRGQPAVAGGRRRGRALAVPGVPAGATGPQTEDAAAGAGALLPTVKPPQPPAELPTSAATGKGSILSALRQERPAKRTLQDATGLFKEVQLPQQLQRQQSQSRPRKSRRVGQDSLLRAAAAGTKSTHNPRTLDFAGMTALEKARIASSARKPGDSELLRRAAITSSAKGPTAPLLHRATSERSHFNGHQAAGGIRSSLGAAVHATGTTAAGSNQSPPLRRAATTSSVVMRTPDRPQRSAVRTTRRVLVEASPPLRRPSGTAVTAPRLLQPKSSRTGSTPPPLFR
ncbi:hypothetical protein ON010_g6242 [Phytophthora cinnamomi]|nr:hypothetical protein ON010_g6242 [Phytophthora cinnamomi]